MFRSTLQGHGDFSNDSGSNSWEREVFQLLVSSQRHEPWMSWRLWYSLYRQRKKFQHRTQGYSWCLRKSLRNENNLKSDYDHGLRPRFLHNSEISLLLVVNNNKYLSYVVDNIIFGISVPDYPSRTVESNSLRLSWNFCIFCIVYRFYSIN